MALASAAYDHDGQMLVECIQPGVAVIRQMAEDGTRRDYAVIQHEIFLQDIRKAVWADITFGSVLAIAAGSYVTIWEDVDGDFAHRATLPGITAEVTDISFAPHHKGLKLAVCCADGFFRTYQCQDVLDFSFWLIMHKIECERCFSVSWSPSPKFTMLVIGLGTGASLPFKIFTEDSLGWKEWEWAKINKALATLGAHKAPIAVAFAPDEQRRFDLLAFVEQGSTEPMLVRVEQKRAHATQGFVDPDEFFLTPLVVKNTDTVVNVDNHGNGMSEDGTRARVVPAPISSVQWNQTGTTLSTAGQDVRLWKALDPMDPEEWRCAHVFIHTSHLEAS